MLTNKITAPAYLVLATAITLIVISALVIPLYIPLNGDSSWLLEATHRLLAGGNYTNNFFEIDPPLILFLNIPVVWLANILHGSLVLLFFIYIFLIALGSLLVILFLSRPLFSQNETSLWVSFVITVAIMFFLLPAHQFGEREHLLILLTMPYFILTLYRYANLEISPYKSFPIGLIAGLGFALKPYFLLPYLLIELRLLIRARKFSFIFRPETYALASIIIVYLIAITLFTPDYLTTVLPHALQLYYLVKYEPLTTLYFNHITLFCYLSTLLYLLAPKYLKHDWICLFFLAAIGFLAVHLLQGANWYYHLFPALTFYFLLLILISGRAIIRGNFYVWGIAFILISYALFLISNEALINSAFNKPSFKIWENLANTIKHKAQNGTIYGFTTTLLPAYPLVHYTTASSCSRFSSLWMLPALLSDNVSQDKKQFFIDAITADIKKGKPIFIFIHQNYPASIIEPIEKNVIRYLCLHNSKFYALWEHYRFYKTIGSFALYQYQSERVTNPCKLR